MTAQPQHTGSTISIGPGSNVRLRLKDGEIESKWYQIKNECSTFDGRCLSITDDITKALIGTCFTPGSTVEFDDFILFDAYND